MDRHCYSYASSQSLTMTSEKRAIADSIDRTLLASATVYCCNASAVLSSTVCTGANDVDDVCGAIHWHYVASHVMCVLHLLYCFDIVALFLG